MAISGIKAAEADAVRTKQSASSRHGLRTITAEQRHHHGRQNDRADAVLKVKVTSKHGSYIIDLPFPSTSCRSYAVSTSWPRPLRRGTSGRWRMPAPPRSWLKKRSSISSNVCRPMTREPRRPAPTYDELTPRARMLPLCIHAGGAQQRQVDRWKNAIIAAVEIINSSFNKEQKHMDYRVPPQ